MKAVVFSAAADRAFSRVPPELQERLIEALYLYAAFGRGDVKRLKGAGAALRLRIGGYRMILEDSETELRVALLGDRKNVYRQEPVVNVQIIRSESGDELVVLPRRDYDALIAELSVLDEEDEALGAAAKDILERMRAGTEPVVNASERYSHLFEAAARKHSPEPDSNG